VTEEHFDAARRHTQQFRPAAGRQAVVSWQHLLLSLHAANNKNVLSDDLDLKFHLTNYGKQLREAEKCSETKLLLCKPVLSE